MGFPRVEFLNLESCDQISQSEEHLVLNCPNQEKLRIGSVLFALPVHICPTVAKFDKVHIVVDNEFTGSWPVSARDHDIEIKN